MPCYQLNLGWCMGWGDFVLLNATSALVGGGNFVLCVAVREYG